MSDQSDPITALLAVTDLDKLGDTMGFAHHLEVTLDSGPFEGWAVSGDYITCYAGDPMPCRAGVVIATAPDGQRHPVPEGTALHAAFELQVHREARQDYRTEPCDGHMLQGPLWELRTDEDGDEILIQLPEPTPDQMDEIVAILRRTTTDEA